MFAVRFSGFQSFHCRLIVASWVLLCLATTGWSQTEQRLAIQFSQQAGKYDKTIPLELTSDPNTKIYFTTDGTRPTLTSQVYQKAVKINKTTVIRAIATDGTNWGRIFTKTYLIGEKTNFPILSIAVEPEILFDKTTGWFNLGTKASPEYPYWGANFWSRQEVGANLEFIESDGKSVFNSRVGLRLFGGMSRVLPQKSFAIACRQAYGETRIRHQIFPDKQQKSFKHIVLRNAGSDWGKAHCRDAMITSLLDDVDVAKQAYRPALLFINGMYWGIYNIREKVNSHYIEYEFGVDRDSVDLIEHRRSVKQGSTQHYDQLLQFLETHSLAEPENYEYVKTQMDVDNFMIYQIVQIYIDNQDGGGNIKYWRSDSYDGRWRWILYDTDWGFGLQQDSAYVNNSLAFHTEPNGPTWPNPPWSTFLLRKLLENPDFQRTFALRFADYMNSIFSQDFISERIDSFYQRLKPEMPRHIKRWELNYNNWLKHLERMRAFSEYRPDYMRNFLQERFPNIGDLVSVQVESTKGGYINLNGNINYYEPLFSGQYFSKIPIRITAIPKRGYQFSHWEGAEAVVTEPTLRLNWKNYAYTLKAVFIPAENDLYGKIVINEISANNKKSGDWIELYNATNQPVELTGWLFRDSKHDFIIPKATIEPKSYLILCQSVQAFRKVFPNRKNVVGDFSFGLNKSEEQLELYTSDSAPIDSVSYRLGKMDGVFTLSLKMPHLNNDNLKNWDIIMGRGTPTLPNPSFLVYQKQQKRQQIYLMASCVLILLVAFSVFRYRNRQKKKE